eukprot:TRINITY_DN1472_c3_g1_i1.p2 TRINITY_DN1472_c3_g1~~TRINITY_DN1472_c3_g1_i1.p2  ORF type:complete len:139 (+),score=29.08 TRINITY_DN1472_c3_g1_i1:60-476(+)
MMKRSVCRFATARLDSAKLFKEINQEPMVGWRSKYQQELSPDVEAQKVAVHNHKTHEYGEGYDELNANNFPYPLMYGTCFILYYLCAVVGYFVDINDAPDTENPVRTFSPKNPDGTTIFRKDPETPSALFSSMLVVKE